MEITKILKYKGPTPSAQCFRIIKEIPKHIMYSRSIEADRFVILSSDSKIRVYVLWKGEKRAYYCDRKLEWGYEGFWDESLKSMMGYVEYGKRFLNIV